MVDDRPWPERAVRPGRAHLAPDELADKREGYVKYGDEEAVKKALEIDSWRDLSKDKVVKFAAMMPDMDKEVSMAIVNQLPVFTRFALDALQVVERAHSKSVEANERSQKEVHRAYVGVRDILKNELDNPNLTPEERRLLIEDVKETADKEFAKDSENKAFVDSLLTKALAGSTLVVVAAIVFVGGKVVLERGGGSSTAEE